MLLGIDVGTGGVRACLYEIDGTLISQGTTKLTTTHFRSGWAEQAPEDWMEGIRVAVRTASAAAAPSKSVSAVAIAATSCTVVVADRDGKPGRPSLMWMDVRAAAEASVVSAANSLERARLAGPNVSAEWLLPKLLWLQRHEKAALDDASIVCDAVDWLTHQLTGEWVASANAAVTRGLYTSGAGWPTSLLDELGITQAGGKLIDRVQPVGSRAGMLTRNAADALGLAAGIPVAVGGGDAYIAVLGLGVNAPGQVALITGSSHVMLAHAAGGLQSPTVLGPYPDPLDLGFDMIEAGLPSSGAIANWFARLLGGSANCHAELDSEALTSEIGARGVRVVPSWQGTRTPVTDADERGSIVGLSLAHERRDLWRAALEGVAVTTRLNLDQLERTTGLTTNRIRACGGVFTSTLWGQIHANSLGIPIEVAGSDPVCLGAAAAAAVGAGHYDDTSQASAAMARVRATIEPEFDTAERYASLADEYAALVTRAV